MKKLFFWICLLSFSFFATDTMANLTGNESAIAENSKMNVVKEKHPRPFKCTVTYNFMIPGVGIGKATHLGLIATESIFDGTIGIEKIHASNGDELYMTWTWDLADNIGTWQITGGTGRFEDAAGSGDWFGVFSPDSQFFTIQLTGDIIY
jgi:hypothetical protein